VKGVSPAYWLLLGATVSVFLAMVVWTLPTIRAEADGLRAFDLRFTGYTFDEAFDFLTALSADGRTLYGGWQSTLDAIFPPLLFATIAIAIWHLSADIRPITRYMIITVAAIAMAADSFENAYIRDMLIAGADGIDVDIVATASLATVVKSAATLVSLSALVVLGVRHWRRTRKEPES